MITVIPKRDNQVLVANLHIISVGGLSRKVMAPTNRKISTVGKENGPFGNERSLRTLPVSYVRRTGTHHIALPKTNDSQHRDT